LIYERVVLPAVHEGGQCLPGVLLCAQIRDVTSTQIGGEAPKVSFTFSPEHATPWVDAGGVILPMMLGLVIVFIWARFCKRFNSQFWLLVLIAGVGLSFNAFGPAVEAFSPTRSLCTPSSGRAVLWTDYDVTNDLDKAKRRVAALRRRLDFPQSSGRAGSAAIALQFIPMLPVLPAFYYAIVRFRFLKSRTPVV
jgi:hypothetical protein